MIPAGRVDEILPDQEGGKQRSSETGVVADKLWADKSLITVTIGREILLRARRERSEGRGEGRKVILGDGQNMNLIQSDG